MTDEETPTGCTCSAAYHEGITCDETAGCDSGELPLELPLEHPTVCCDCFEDC